METKGAFNPEKDIPDLAGKVFSSQEVGTSGLGKQTILTLAKHGPKHIAFTGRNKKNADSVLSEVKKIAPHVETAYYECDQSSLASVNGAANAFLSTEPTRLDVLICNAGIMGGPMGLTKDGYEIQFGINFLAHTLFTKRFIPLLDRTATEFGEARVVNLTSSGYTMFPGPLSFDELKTTQKNIGMGGKWARYGQSKFAQVIFGSQLAKHYSNITVVSIHPGVVHTNLVEGQPFLDRIFVKMTTIGQSVPLEQGTYNTLWAATIPLQGSIESGSVYYPVGQHQKHTKAASDAGQWKRLWEWTEQQLE
ncbi:dehydrogenase with different specificitie [Polyplosphaeria fusca]|uniref:Dehydrogenase with different specificitie n=1 Tax=Polyplosphaeria fusca TaxID=682080 RepID=A0A9P4RCF4_9PLEO|nr:dehydrogenase with different specificitie [Polyplosphaeria fusca]